MIIKDIQKARSGKDRDRFPVGTVIRWVNAGRYDYAAIKTQVGWFTTARYGNAYVPQTPTWEEMLSILGRNETTGVEIATTWDSVPESE